MAGLVSANSAQPLLVTGSGRLPEDNIVRDSGHLSLPSPPGPSPVPADPEQNYLDDGGAETNDSFKVSPGELQQIAASLVRKKAVLEQGMLPSSIAARMGPC